ncbi:MAG: hypothetical protein RLZZ232_604 [Planctomycetota bacterium]|jgi:FkbM family methyltransferase
MAAVDHFHVNPKGLSVCRDFLDAPASKRFLFGATPYAESLLKSIEVAGILDDRITAGQFAGIPVVRLRDCPPDALVVSTILGRIRTAHTQLQQRSIRYCDLFTFCRCSGLALPEMRFVTGFREEAQQNAEHWDQIGRLLSDARSKQEFQALRDFRLSGDSELLSGFSDRQHEQYFEEFLDLRTDGECFADVGSFDGATTVDFIRRCPGFARAWVFEPDPAGFSTVSRRFSSEPRISCYPCAASDKSGVETFSSSGSTSACVEGGEICVETRALDEFDLKDLSFLKMDIEGAESRAIQGARQSILRWHPRMAICVYHHPGDIWRIPQQVLQIRSDYRLHLRHYTEGVVETVIFFQPNP